MDYHSLLANIGEVIGQLVYAWEWKAFFAGTITVVSFLFGVDLIMPITALLVLIFLDFVLGSIVAYKENKYCSKKAMKTAYKILIYGGLIVAAHMYDISVHFGNVFEMGMVAFLSSNEFISIMRNANKLGYQTPKKLVDMATEVLQRK
jgi:toxin secretion/phage lysis holin